MPNSILFFSKKLTEWYNMHKRDLPWRHTKDPYKIWISEIILQQTRVVQGYEYYNRFIKAYPNIESLAKAAEMDVLKLWQGLGYYSRARNLHHTAKEIFSIYSGVFPTEYKKILALKGVGEYTAAAIASFAYNQPYAVLDGNVFRVLSRLFDIETPIDTTSGKKAFTNLAYELLDTKQPDIHNQAIMEFGAIQCVPSSPNCQDCILNNRCIAYASKKVEYLPVKRGKIKTTNRYFNYFDIRNGDSLYLSKRIQNDIWKNLYELPLIETSKKFDFKDLKQTKEFQILFQNNIESLFIHPIEIRLKHVLSHQIINAVFYRIEISDNETLNTEYSKIKIGDVSNYPISRLVDKYFEKIDANKNELWR